MIESRPSPATESTLIGGVQSIAGRTLGELAERFGMPIPASPQRAKGFAGRLLEAALGASAGSKGAPDFEELGIELKTLPINRNGRPTESTWLTRVQLEAPFPTSWKESRARRKLARVLWIPIDGDPRISLGERRVGCGLLWDLEPDLEQILQKDWEGHMESVRHGQVDSITAHQGTYLQVRPKAANSRERCLASSSAGLSFETLPRGFYLRTAFTTMILSRHYAIT